MEQNNNNPATGERTFTQEQVNAIVSERLAKEKQKGENAFAEREQQFAEREKALANREALIDLKDQLKEKGLPAELLPVLNVQDKQALQPALDARAMYIEQLKAKDPRRIYNQLHLPHGEPYDTEDDEKLSLRKAMGLR